VKTKIHVQREHKYSKTEEHTIKGKIKLNNHNQLSFPNKISSTCNQTEITTKSSSKCNQNNIPSKSSSKSTQKDIPSEKDISKF